MPNELDLKSERALQKMVNVQYLPTVPEIDLVLSSAAKIPIANLTAWGVAFQPLAAVIQRATTGGGGSGLYFADTKGKQMFQFKNSPQYLGSLRSENGGVGGGQAEFTQLLCDPTMLCMAAVLMHIEKKLDAIQETQEEILEFLEEKERAALQGNLNVLGEAMTNYKYNWDNTTYKANKHILVQQIKKEAEASIILYRNQIGKKLRKRSFIHADHAVKDTLNKLQVQFKDYHLALYLYAYSTFLEVMLLGNFGEGYLDSVERRIAEYSLQYRTLYTDCYNQMEEYSKSSIQAGMLSGLSVASKFMGETIAKVPVISNSQLDENLIEAGQRLDKHGSKRTIVALEGFAQNRTSMTLPFVENIREVNNLYNKPVVYLFDKENIYVRQIAE